MAEYCATLVFAAGAGRVVQTAGVSSRTNDEIGGKIVTTHVQSLRVLGRYRDGSPGAEILAYAESVLTLPDETGGVLASRWFEEEFLTCFASTSWFLSPDDHICPPVKVRLPDVSLRP